ncbi:MAG: glycosyltransferase family 2 protein [Demequinaceae bacterium]|nr:glycosyltransferase family 2 protein [Demequinaceae bacterium]
MSAEPRLLVIVPALNEREALPAVIREIRAANPGADVLVVDDGSTDDTAVRAWEAGALVAKLPYNLGVGGAMRTGFRYALDHGYDMAAQVDADGQHNPADLPALVAALAEADVAMGARFAGVGDYEARGPRRWAMVVLARVLSAVCKTRLTDATSGFKVANRRALEVWAQNYPAEYLGDTIEALVIAARSGLTVRQVPVSMRVRAGGVASHHPWKATVYLARAMLALVFALMRPATKVSRVSP